MTDSSPDPAALKRAAATKALDYIQKGMKLGLGTGSTAEAFLDVLAPRVRGGLSITGVATSERTAVKARSLGIPIADLDLVGELDLVIDGTDESDHQLNLIKGGGGAHLIEKLVARAARKMVVIADGSKLVTSLGQFPLPLEVVPFGHVSTARRIRHEMQNLGYSITPVLRQKDGTNFTTDSGNLIYDCAFGAIHDPSRLATHLSSITGIVEHGLFIGMASILILARPEGVEVIEKA